MRANLILAAIVAITAVSSADSNVADSKFNASEEQPVRKDVFDNVPSCRYPFTPYNGWCVFSSSATLYYQDAVTFCANVGEFAPSLHSKDDHDFWSNYTKINNHLWLDAYCAIPGQPYVWRDGTATDYFGPNNELKQCSASTVFHLESDGELRIWLITDNSSAYAVCVYNPQPGSTAPTTTMVPTKTTTPLTTTKLTTPLASSTTKAPTPKPTDETSSYCSCNPNKIFLDIVFIVDTSADMTKDIVGDATATIQSTLYGLTFGTDYYQSNVAAIAFADSVQTVRNFGGFRTTKDITSFSLPYLGGSPTNMAGAIKQASSMISSNARSFTKGVIVLLTNSFYQSGKSNINKEADSFTNDGGIFISIDYSKGLGIKDLEDIASPGFYINDTTTNPQLDGDILYALCDVNCFCRDGLVSYNAQNERGREVPTGCYHIAEFSSVYAAAEDNCQSKNGFVATIHDDAKNFFMISLFPPKSRFWLGFTRNGGSFEWADGSTDKFTYWASGNPVAGQDCVYAQQQTGFNSLWFSAPCTDPLKNSMTYACQIRPCDTEYDCRV